MYPDAKSVLFAHDRRLQAIGNFNQQKEPVHSYIFTS